MEISLGLPNTIAGIRGDELLEWARRADRGGFASVAALDRVAYDSFDPLATLAACAGATERVRLATMVVIGPLRNTAILGKTAASIRSRSSRDWPRR